MTDPTSSVQTVGWIGTGRMGLALATRVARAGFDLTATNRTRAKAEPLTGDGVTIVDSPPDLSSRDVVVTMLSDGPAVRQALVGASGLFSSGRGPRLVVDCSSIAIADSVSLRQELLLRGCDLVAAPISGNPKVVSSGRAAVVASGPRAAFDAVEPVLAAFGTSVTWVGDAEQARTVKIAHNVVLGMVIQALAETAVLAERSGVPRSAYLAFLNDSVMGSVFSRYKTPALVNLDLRPTFTSALLRKDLDLGLSEAAALGVQLPLTQVTRAQVDRLVRAGRTELDFAELVVLAAEDAGYEIEAEAEPVGDGLPTLDDLGPRAR
jgi:3-hydroxyisobutyrate dehydrogenase-like beta-hydroxyacid dehydrogenase